MDEQEIAELRRKAERDQAEAFVSDVVDVAAGLAALVSTIAETITILTPAMRRLNRAMYKAGVMARPQSRYRQTSRGRVPRLGPMTRAAQQELLARSGRR